MSECGGLRGRGHFLEDLRRHLLGGQRREQCFGREQHAVGEHRHRQGLDVVGDHIAAVVGGGLGCAIAYPQAKYHHEHGASVDIIAGFRNKDLVILEDDFQQDSDRFIMMSDDGSVGEKGLVTDALRKLLEKETFDEVIAIGPLIMMKFVCQLTKEFNVKTVVSMNPIMIDGTGMCGGCRLSVGGKMKFACVDGTDFDGHEVDFDEAMVRNMSYRDFEHHAYEKTCNLLNQEVK